MTTYVFPHLGTLYTGSADGKIFSIKGHNVTLLTHTGSAHSGCGSPEMEAECGRPKGMAIGSDGALYVVDSYKGLLRLDTSGKNLEILVASQKGRSPHFASLNTNMKVII